MKKYNIFRQANKANSDIEPSAYVLDFSKKENNIDIGYVCSRAKRKSGFLKKTAAVFIFLSFSGAAIYGSGIYRSFKAIKSSSLTANAMSEENMAEIGKLTELINILPDTKETKKIKELAESFENFKKILGFDWPKKYLLIFQNPGEARATGGFIGSVGVLTINAAKIKNIALNDVYNIDGQLTGNIEPPRPIKKISAAWSLHDANWFFDFPATAKKIGWFYEKAGGETMDGVIAVNPQVVLDLLKAVGPVKMEKYGAELTEKNFIETTQREVEIGYNKTVNQPKTFLADFLEELNNKFGSLPLYKKITAVKNFIHNLDQKDIQIYFSDNGSQSFVENHNWSGKVNDSQKDYLAIVHSNINGFKTDAVMEEEASLLTEIGEDGSVVNTLAIARRHNGESEMDEWYRQVNSDYLRIYVPRGSALIETKGLTEDDYLAKDNSVDYDAFIKDSELAEIEKNKTIDVKNNVEILEESDKTVFGAWVYVSAGEKTVASYRYKLPFKIDFNSSKDTGVYSMLFQKQSGSKLQEINHEISFPENWKTIGHYGDFSLKNGKIIQKISAESDNFSGIIFAK